MLWQGDNLPLLREMPDDAIDLIYLDPPFNKKRKFAATHANKTAEFTDVFRLTDAQQQWASAQRDPALIALLEATKMIGDRSNFPYLCFLAMRLLELRRMLKPTGSLYLHCDQTMAHYVKLLLDVIFGEAQFRNEIIWGYRTGGISKRHFPRKHDTILLYSKTQEHTFHPQFETIAYDKPFFLPRDTQPDADGKYRIEVRRRDVWDNDIRPVINVSKQRAGYPTQKPLALLQRLITASSNAGDLVFDPFCGSGTTLIAAETLQRQWIGCDLSPQSARILKTQLQADPQLAHVAASLQIQHSPF